MNAINRRGNGTCHIDDEKPAINHCAICLLSQVVRTIFVCNKTTGPIVEEFLMQRIAADRCSQADIRRFNCPIT